MRLIVELETDRFDETEAADRSALLLALKEIEIRQVGGLLSFTRRIAGIEVLSGAVVHHLGLPEDGGITIRVFTTKERENG